MAVMDGEGVGICLTMLELRFALIRMTEPGVGSGPCLLLVEVALVMVGYITLHFCDAMVSHVLG